MNRKGKIVIPEGANVWPHEMESARVLARQGYVVEFLRAIDQKGRQTADCLLDGELWEMKAPTASNIKAVERNLKRGKWQSGCIVFDSRRMKKVPDKVIEHELRRHRQGMKGIERVKFINRHGEVLDI